MGEAPTIDVLSDIDDLLSDVAGSMFKVAVSRLFDTDEPWEAGPGEDWRCQYTYRTDEWYVEQWNAHMAGKAEAADDPWPENLERLCAGRPVFSVTPNNLDALSYQEEVLGHRRVYVSWGGEVRERDHHYMIYKGDEDYVPSFFDEDD